MLGAHLQRRRSVLLGTAALLAGGGTLAAASGRARAELTIDELSIPDARFADDDGNLHAPWLDIQGRLEYANVDRAGMIRVYLLVNGDIIQSIEREASQPSDTVEFAIAGDITASSHYGSSDFTAQDDGTSVEVTVPVMLLGQVRDGQGTTLIDANVSEDVIITVANETVSVSAGVGGEGTVLFQNNQSDDPPVSQ